MTISRSNMSTPRLDLQSLLMRFRAEKPRSQMAVDIGMTRTISARFRMVGKLLPAAPDH